MVEEKAKVKKAIAKKVIIEGRQVMRLKFAMRLDSGDRSRDTGCTVRSAYLLPW